jgi:Fe-S-cluster containining protein
MKTDLKEIARIAKSKENENWKFRSFLKGYDMEIEELDSIVHELYHQVTAEIDCTKCANCCKQAKPTLSQNDIEELSKGIGLSEQKLKTQFFKKDEDGDYVFKKTPCPFLKCNLCTQYNFRPEACRSFPHLHKEEFVFRLIQVIENYSICPIAFNVYELLKTELFDDYNSFIKDMEKLQAFQAKRDGALEVAKCVIELVESKL